MASVKDETMNKKENAGKKGGGKSFFKVGIPVLIVQIIAAYFLASYLILPTFFDRANANPNDASESAAAEDDRDFGFIFKVEDVIVNPAESQGAQFVLVNIAFEVKEEGDMESLKTREAKIRDSLINIISGKTIDQLDGPDDKEALRLEIKEQVAKMLPKDHLYNIYFVNYIIQ